MQLEDHLGDILRKGREAKGLPVGTAAQVVGVPEAAYLALEQSGQIPGASALRQVGRGPRDERRETGADGQGLEPVAPDLSFCGIRQITT